MQGAVRFVVVCAICTNQLACAFTCGYARTYVLIYCLQRVCIPLLSPFETFPICCCASQIVTIVLFFPHKTLLCVAVSNI